MYFMKMEVSSTIHLIVRYHLPFPFWIFPNRIWTNLRTPSSGKWCNQIFGLARPHTRHNAAFFGTLTHRHNHGETTAHTDDSRGPDHPWPSSVILNRLFWIRYCRIYWYYGYAFIRSVVRNDNQLLAIHRVNDAKTRGAYLRLRIFQQQSTWTVRER